MEYEQLLKLIKVVADSSLTGFKYEEDDVKISMQSEQVQMMSPAQAAPVVMPVSSLVQTTQPVAVIEETPSGNILKSPLVGTFYSASSEDVAPFVAVGDTVKKGQTLAIVEAMKLMNDIECEFDGVIAEIYVENGEAVEYGQSLFRIS